MGWQSYIIFFDSKETKDAIISAIKAHNNETNWDIVGETIVMVVERKIKSNKKPKFVVTPGMSTIMFGNGGGRSYTFKYFEDLGFEIFAYDRSWDKWYESHDTSVVLSTDGETWNL